MTGSILGSSYASGNTQQWKLLRWITSKCLRTSNVPTVVAGVTAGNGDEKTTLAIIHPVFSIAVNPCTTALSQPLPIQPNVLFFPARSLRAGHAEPSLHAPNASPRPGMEHTTVCDALQLGRVSELANMGSDVWPNANHGHSSR